MAHEVVAARSRMNLAAATNKAMLSSTGDAKAFSVDGGGSATSSALFGLRPGSVSRGSRRWDESVRPHGRWRPLRQSSPAYEPGVQGLEPLRAAQLQV